MGALDVVQLVFVVLVNPDGYEFSRSSPATDPPYNASCYDARGQVAIRCWRKNRRPPPSGFPPSCTGVDLNRNFPNHWGGATSSDDPCSDVYKGPRAESEPEVQAVRSLIHRLSTDGQLVAGIDFHAFGEFILTQPGWTSNNSAISSEVFDEMTDIGKTMKASIAKQTGTQYVVKPGWQMYSVGGSLAEYYYRQTTRQIGFTMELRLDHSVGSFILEPSQIRPVCLEVEAMVVDLLTHVDRQNVANLKR